MSSSLLVLQSLLVLTNFIHLNCHLKLIIHNLSLNVHGHLEKSGVNNQDMNAVVSTVYLISAISQMFWSFAFIFFFWFVWIHVCFGTVYRIIICFRLNFISEFGERVINKFNEFDDELCEGNWYLFPPEMRKLYLIFMNDTQQPAYMYGFGNILCTRDVFKKVRIGTLFPLFTFTEK